MGEWEASNQLSTELKTEIIHCYKLEEGCRLFLFDVWIEGDRTADFKRQMWWSGVKTAGETKTKEGPRQDTQKPSSEGQD